MLEAYIPILILLGVSVMNAVGMVVAASPRLVETG